MHYCPILFLTRPASYCDTFIREVQSLCLKYVVTSGQSLASRFPVFNLCAKLCEPARGELLLPVSQPRYRLLSAQLTWGICTNQHLSPRTTPNSSLLSVTLTSQAPLPQTSSSIPACWAVFSARCSENTAITHCFLLGAKIPLHWLQFSFFFLSFFFFFLFWHSEECVFDCCSQHSSTYTYKHTEYRRLILQFARAYSVTSCRPLQLAEVRCLLGSAI